MTYVLGVDPGVTSGWCLFGDGKPLEWGQTGKPGQRTTGKDVDGVLNAIVDNLSRTNLYELVTLAIEGQFIPDAAGKGDRQRHMANSALVTARMAGIWIGICQAHGLEVLNMDGIAPVAWRSAVWGGRWTTEQAKRHSVEMAASVWGVRILKTHHHTAEAMWIASYAWTELQGR